MSGRFVSINCKLPEDQGDDEVWVVVSIRDCHGIGYV